MASMLLTNRHVITVVVSLCLLTAIFYVLFTHTNEIFLKETIKRDELIEQYVKTYRSGQTFIIKLGEGLPIEAFLNSVPELHWFRFFYYAGIVDDSAVLNCRDTWHGYGLGVEVYYVKVDSILNMEHGSFKVMGYDKNDITLQVVDWTGKLW